jgi:hypothetical protein
MLRAVLFALVVVVGPFRADAAEPLRVLFVGNSLTYTNELPRIVEALSRGGGMEIEAGMIAFPNAGLEDHWADGRTRREIASKRWDVVVMQQGPSSLASSRANLVEWAKRLAEEARAAGARPALFTVWPDASRRAYLGAVIESYEEAAEACGCELLPVGLAWQEAWKRRARLSLYGADGFHPSEEGSYLAALVIWGGLTGEDVARAPAELDLGGGQTMKVREKRAAVYRDAAEAALTATAGN